MLRAASASQRQIARGLGAGVEVLVIPPFWRGKHAYRSPVNSNSLLPLLPEQGITFSRQNDDMRPEAVAMRLFVGPDLELRKMAGHRVVGHRYMKALRPRAAANPIDQRKLTHVLNKIGAPNAPTEVASRGC